MKKNWGALAGLVIILATLGFSAAAFKTSLVSYVPFSDARTTPGGKRPDHGNAPVRLTVLQ